MQGAGCRSDRIAPLNAGVIAFDLVVGPFIVLLLFFAIAGWRVSRRRGRLDDAWLLIIARLDRRHELVAELIETAEPLVPAERQALAGARLAHGQASRASGVVAASRAERELTSALHALFAACEDYTQLHATPAFLQLEGLLSRVEAEIGIAVRRYNRDVATFNRKVSTYPGTLVAKRFGFAPLATFQLSQPRPEPAVVVELPRAA
jgi:LemA protein